MYTIYAVHIPFIRSSVLIFCCVYLYNGHKKECTFDIFDEPILRVYVTKKRGNKCRNTRTNSFFSSCILKPISPVYTSSLVNFRSVARSSIAQFVRPSVRLSLTVRFSFISHICITRLGKFLNVHTPDIMCGHMIWKRGGGVT